MTAGLFSQRSFYSERHNKVVIARSGATRLRAEALRCASAAISLDCPSALSPSALSSEPKGSRPNGFASLAMTYQMATYLVRVISVQKRFSINGKTNTGSALRNPVTKGPESVIPAEAGIQAIELNDRTTGCPLSRA